MEEDLRELLQDTPLGRMKLLAAWDGVTTETQIKLLRTLAASRLIVSEPWDKAIWLRALDSSNEYIRYFAACELRLRWDRSDDARTLQAIEKIQSD
jgi:hypothetical protein